MKVSTPAALALVASCSFKAFKISPPNVTVPAELQRYVNITALICQVSQAEAVPSNSCLLKFRNAQSLLKLNLTVRLALHCKSQY